MQAIWHMEDGQGEGGVSEHMNTELCGLEGWYF